MNRRFDALDQRLARTMTSDDKTEILNGLDASTKELDDERTEHAILKNQMARCDAWFQQIADKLGISLHYE